MAWIKARTFDRLRFDIQKKVVSIIFLLPVMLGFVVFFAYPLITSLIYSFSTVRLSPEGVEILFNTFFSDADFSSKIFDNPLTDASILYNYSYALTIDAEFPVELLNTLGNTAADCAVIVTSAGSGIDVGLEKAIKAADARKIAKFFAITKVDSDNRDFYKTFEALRAELGNKLCPVVVPYMNGPVCEAFVNLCSNRAFKYPNGRPQEIDLVSDDNIIAMRAALEEAVATVDEDGNIFAIAPGETKITLNFAGNDMYLPNSTEVLVTVHPVYLYE